MGEGKSIIEMISICIRIMWLTLSFITAVLSLDECGTEMTPLVMVVLLARNKAHTLPYFLTYFGQLNYPKDRLALHIRADHSEDRTIDILEDWVRKYRNEYYRVDDVLDRSEHLYKSESTNERSFDSLENVISLKEEALITAHKKNMEYVWFLDVDVFLTNADVLFHLIEKDEPIISPMLSSTDDYTNFWLFTTNGFDEVVDEEHSDIFERVVKGCFDVYLVKESLLIHLSTTAGKFLTFDPKSDESYDGPLNDVVAFSYSAEVEDVPTFLCNDYHYGYVMPPAHERSKLQEETVLQNLLVLIVARTGQVLVENFLKKYLPVPPSKTKLNLDEIYYLNLDRRPKRQVAMEAMTEILGIDANRWSAVDGQLLNSSKISELGVVPVPGYRDVLQDVPLTFGEIGCFLSHYGVWEHMLRHGYEEVLILEDDIVFLPNFKAKFQQLQRELAEVQLEWDLIYIDRLNNSGRSEKRVDNCSLLVEPGFSYLANGYLLSRSGAEKLVAAEPLKKLIPVDEYLPIMYDQPYMFSVYENFYVELFPVRNLKAYAAEPTLLEMAFYSGDQQYVSDTLDSRYVEDWDEDPDEKGDQGDQGDHQLDKEVDEQGFCQKDQIDEGDEHIDKQGDEQATHLAGMMNRVFDVGCFKERCGW